MVTIVDSQIRQTIYKTVRDRLKAASYSSSVTPTVISAYSTKVDVATPQIVISPVDIAKSSFTIGSDRKAHTKNITVTIDIYTKLNKDLDILSDEVDDLMTDDFTGFCLSDASETEGQYLSNEQQLRVKSLTYTFIRR